jgi:hypothetical protein
MHAAGRQAAKHANEQQMHAQTPIARHWHQQQNPLPATHSYPRAQKAQICQFTNTLGMVGVLLQHMHSTWARGRQQQATSGSQNPVYSY